MCVCVYICIYTNIKEGNYYLSTRVSRSRRSSASSTPRISEAISFLVNSFIYIYIYTYILKKEKNYTFIPTSLFRDYSLFRGF